MNAERLPPGLHIVATPIGNLGDLSLRAADTLRRADLVLAEDKRVTAKLLSHAGVKTKLANYSDHTSEAERDGPRLRTTPAGRLLLDRVLAEIAA